MSDDKLDKKDLAFFGILVLVLFAALCGAIYGARYRWGLVGPRFKAETCVVNKSAANNEFLAPEHIKYIYKVGKKTYLLLSYSTELGRFYGAEENSIADTDEYSTELECPKKLLEILKESKPFSN